MKVGEKIRVRIHSGTPRCDLSYPQTYAARILHDLGDGNIEISLVDDTGVVLETTLLKSYHLNGGDFKIVLSGV